MFDFTKLTARRQARTLGQVVQLGTLNSTLKGYVSIFDITGTAVTNLALNTWTKVVTNSVEGFTSNDFITAPNRITSTKKRRIVKLEVVISVQSGASNNLHFAIYKNGVIHAPSEQDLTTDGTGRSTSVPMQCITELLPGDFVEVWTKNAAHNTPVTLEHFHFIATEL